MEPRPRQAVILIHGIGEQRPMATLRAFVDGLLPFGDYHSKSDQISGSYEMRRIKLRRTAETGTMKWPETDFYEYYWAHHMYGTLTAHVIAWLWRLLSLGTRERRNFSDSRHHPRLKSMIPLAGIAAVIGLLGLVLLSVSAVRAPETTAKLGLGVAVALALWKLLIAPIVRSALINVVGDAARYFDVAPQNVARRYDILRGGVKLLRKLHEEQDEKDGKVMYRYHRVVLIGHSLGSVIAYDILRHYWSEVNGRIPADAVSLLNVESFEGGNESASFSEARPYSEPDTSVLSV